MSVWKLGDANKTVAYLLPMLSQNNKVFMDNFHDNKKYPERNFVSAFARCEEYPELKNHLFVIYLKETDNPVFQNFETRLRHLPEYDFEYEPNDRHRVYVYNIPEHYHNIYSLFFQGKYSKFPESYKDNILKFHRLNPELYLKQSDTHKNKIVGVLFKQKWVKEEIESVLLNPPNAKKIDWVKLPDDAEYSSSPYMEQETYLNIYKQ